MRIGYIRPSINGVGIGAMIPVQVLPGVTSMKPEVTDMLAEDIQSWSVSSPGGSAAPAILSDLQGYCSLIKNADPNCNPATLAQLVQQQVGGMQAGAGLNIDCSNPNNAVYCGGPAPAPLVASSSQVQYSSQPQNALDRVTPQQSNILPSPVQNALSPPQSPATVSGQNQGSFTGSQQTTNPPGPSSSVNIAGMEIPTWALLGIAGLGLFLMMKGK